MQPAEFAEYLAHLRGRELAPAILAEQIASHVPAQPFGIRTAMFELARPAPETAAADLERRARVAAAILGIDRYRAAQRIESEQGIRPRHQRDLRNRDLGNQIPGNDIAEGLVLPDPVHINRNALRRAQQRRSGVAAVVHIGLVWILLVLIDVDAAQPLIQQIGEIQRAGLLQVARARGLHRRRDLIDRQIGSGKRSSRHHVDPRRLGSQLQRYRARDWCPGLHIDQHGLRCEAVLGNFQAIAAV